MHVGKNYWHSFIVSEALALDQRMQPGSVAKVGKSLIVRIYFVGSRG